LAAGATEQFLATGTFSDGSALPLNALVTWTATDLVATIDATGVATGMSAGSASISAALGGIAGVAALTVTAPAAAPQATVQTVTLTQLINAIQSNMVGAANQPTLAGEKNAIADINGTLTVLAAAVAPIDALTAICSNCISATTAALAGQPNGMVMMNLCCASSATPVWTAPPIILYLTLPGTAPAQ
jgi:hypothetical protein